MKILSLVTVLSALGSTSASPFKRNALITAVSHGGANPLTPVAAAKMSSEPQPGGGGSQGHSSASDRGYGDNQGTLKRSAGSRDSRASSGSSVRQNKPFAQYKFSVAQEPVVEEGVHDNSSGPPAKRGPSRHLLQDPHMN